MRDLEPDFELWCWFWHWFWFWFLYHSLRVVSHPSHLVSGSFLSTLVLSFSLCISVIENVLRSDNIPCTSTSLTIHSIIMQAGYGCMQCMYCLFCSTCDPSPEPSAFGPRRDGPLFFPHRGRPNGFHAISFQKVDLALKCVLCYAVV